MICISNCLLHISIRKCTKYPKFNMAQTELLILSHLPDCSSFTVHHTHNYHLHPILRPKPQESSLILFFPLHTRHYPSGNPSTGLLNRHHFYALLFLPSSLQATIILCLAFKNLSSDLPFCFCYVQPTFHALPERYFKN